MVFFLILGVGFARTSASGSIWGNQERFLSWILFMLMQEVIGYWVIVQWFDLSLIVCNTVYIKVGMYYVLLKNYQST